MVYNRCIFGSGKYAVAVNGDILESVAEKIVEAAWNNLPPEARTARIIHDVIQRASDAVDNMNITSFSQINLE